jgi:hypothetical protein
MLPATVHRKWAREFLARAETAPDQPRKLKYLRLAVDNTLRAQTVEHDQQLSSWRPDDRAARS